MFDITGNHKIRCFNLKNEYEREECEKVLSKYSQLMGRIIKYDTCFTKDGDYVVALHWVEDVDESEYRD